MRDAASLFDPLRGDPPFRDPDPAGEAQWPARIRAGDVAALEELYDAYYARLCAYAEGYLRDPAAAEEVVENLFVRIWERRDAWNLRGSLRRYVYGATRKAALSYLRNRRIREGIRRGIHSIGRAPAMGEVPPSPDDEIEVRELATILEGTIAGLPERSREAFLLARQHELSYAEIAAVMEISISTVEKHIARATKCLRDALSAWRRDP